MEKVSKTPVARLFSSYGAALVARAAVNYVAKDVFQGLHVKTQNGKAWNDHVFFSVETKPGIWRFMIFRSCRISISLLILKGPISRRPQLLAG